MRDRRSKNNARKLWGEGTTLGKQAGSLARIAGTLPYVLMLLPVMVAALYVRQYGVNAPYNDGLTLIPLFEKLFAGGLTFGDLAAQHNEHRIFFPRIAMLLLGLVTGFNDVAMMYAILACLLVTTGALFALFRGTVSQSPWLFVPVPFLVFNLGQSWNMLQGFQITLAFVQTFAVLCFVLLYLSDGPRRGERRGSLAFCGALVCGTIAAFSSAPGLLVWPLGFFQLLLLSIERRAKMWLAGAWVLAGTLNWTLYLRGYESSETTTWRESLGNPLDSMEYLLSALGASLFHGSQELALACGLLLIFLVAVSLLLICEGGRVRQNSVWISLLAFAALTLAATTLARGGSLEDALNPKYVTYSVLAPIAVFALLAGSVRVRRESVSLLSLGVLGIVAAASLLLSYSQGMAEAKEIAENKERTAFVLATHESQPDEILASRGVLRERFRVDPDTSRRQANFLERRGYSIFSEPRPEVLPPPLPDPSPGAAARPYSAHLKANVEVKLMRHPSGDDGKSFVEVSGWAANPGSKESVRGVYVLVDGRPYPAFYGQQSSKAARRFDDSAYEYSGFKRAIPLSEIGDGEHELSVVAVTDTGEAELRLGPPGSDGKQQMKFEL